MNSPAQPDELALAQLRADFPGHRIWRSTRCDGRLGDWIATLHDPYAGVDPTVVRATADSLRKELEAQGELARQRATGGRMR